MRGRATVSPGRRLVCAIAVSVALLATGAAPASAFRGGAVDDPANRNPALDGPTGKTYLLNNGWDLTRDRTVVVGNHYDRTYTGDFDGDGTDSIVWRRGNTYALGRCTVTFGRVNDQAFVGDWDGDGTDTLAVRQGRTIIYTNTPCGRGERKFMFGTSTDVVLVGDWNGDGKDTFAVRRGSTYRIKDNLVTGRANRVVYYGRPTDTALVGDWDGDGRDTLAVRRGNTVYVKNTTGGRGADFVARYGRASDAPLVGDWNGDGKDTLGVRRPDAIPTPRNRPEQIAARYGMSVRYAAADNRCSSRVVGCFGLSLPYIWLSRTLNGKPRTAAQLEHSAFHEVGHSLQYKACGRMNLPRLEPMANAIADILQNRPRGTWVGVNTDMNNAAAIIAGRCPF